MDSLLQETGLDHGLSQRRTTGMAADAVLPWRRARQPLYMSLAQQLREGLRQGHWPARQALPSERELADLLAVSRETARKAMDLLCERGWLQRVQGSGTYASLPQPQAQPQPHRSSAALPTPVLPPAAVIRQLSHRRRLADAREWQLFGLAAGSEVWQGLSMACSPTGAPELHSRILPVGPGRDAVPCALSEAEQTDARPARLIRIEALAANAQQAHYLGLRSGEAVLRLSHVQTSPEGQVLALLHSDCKGAEACFSLETPIPS